MDADFVTPGSLASSGTVVVKPVRLTKARPAGARAAPATAGGSGSGKEGEGDG